MRFPRIFALIGSVLLLTACSGMLSHSEVDALNEIDPVGSAFTQKLALEYRDFANYEQNEMFDYADSLHFARKGLMAAEGDVVLPEPLENWRIDDEFVEELLKQRGRLMVAFDKGARELVPTEAGFAQFSYDCWIEQQEENWQVEDIAACRDQFYSAMTDLELALNDTVPEIVEEVAEVIVVQEPQEVESTTGFIPIEEAMFLVFFDFDKNKIATSGLDVIDAVAAEIQGRSDITAVVITGHTDTFGPDAYNQRLSKRRAESAKASLIAKGVSEDLIRVDAMGEKNQLVSTPNDTREPANRRAEIRFE